LSVLNCDSLKALSSETCGRLKLRDAPSEASSCASVADYVAAEEVDDHVRHQEDSLLLGRERGDVPRPACMTPSEAARACAKVGGSLPTFHEMSLLAGGLREQNYPWGNEPPSCADAVVARVSLNRTPALCASKELGGYPVGPRSVDERAARDVLALPGANVLQLGGNISEWVTATNAPTCVEESSMSIRCDEMKCLLVKGQRDYLAAVARGIR
jgi:formylglycine-generating enzyme required for sulfatase activity